MEAITQGSDPTATLRAFLPDDVLELERIMEPLRARYVETDRDDIVRRHIVRLHRNACARRNPRLAYDEGNRRNGIGFAVISESGAGKSTTLERIFGEYSAFGGYGVVGSGCAIITVEAPSPCTLAQIAMLILEKLGYSPERELRENVAWRRVRKMLRREKIFFVHIDEAANVLHQKSEHEIQKIADTFRSLMLSKEWPVQIILSGVPELLDLFDQDRQLRRRMKYVRFENVSAAEDADLIEATLRGYAKAAKLPVRFTDEDALIPRLCHAAVYQFGLVIELVVDAIEACLTDEHKALTKQDFANGYAERTLQPVDLNPFVVPAWDTLDCSAVREKPKKPTGEEDQALATARKRGRRKGRR